MANSSLPLDIKSFLIENIDSVSHLEVLLRLFENPNEWFNAEKVSKESRSNLSSATAQLENLKSHGLLIKNESHQYMYQPVSEELSEKVVKLNHLYHEKPVAVISTIFDKPSDKLKGFADAFKFKKD